MPGMHEKLADQITANEKTFSEIFKALDAGGSHNDYDPIDSLHEEPLEVVMRRQVSVVLTTGGPHVEIEATIDEDGDITQPRWVAYWGGEKVERPIASDEAAHRALTYFTEGLGL